MKVCTAFANASAVEGCDGADGGGRDRVQKIKDKRPKIKDPVPRTQNQ